jgi:predicted glycosyltransferase involved in capsule biosynthesis
MEITIAITTFSKRFDYVSNLIPQIRFFSEAPIMIIVNGEKEGKLDDVYLKKMLSLCSKYNQVYPVFFQETRGLSKMWNTAIVNSFYDNILLLNDDIEIKSQDIFDFCDFIINSKTFSGLTKINGSYSHFVVNKQLMEEVGYFDERLMGFGEEDGDITYRLLKIGKSIGDYVVNGVVNIISNVRHDHVKSGIGKYSKFNRDFIYNEKYKPNLSGNIKGMFDTPMDEVLVNENQYPYEKYFRENKKNL